MRNILGHPVLEKLLNSPNYRRIVERAEGASIKRKVHGSNGRGIVHHAALVGASGPTPSQRMTRQERARLAKSIQRSASELQEGLGKVLEFGVPSQFQAAFDGFALDCACTYAETFEEPQSSELEENDTFHFARYAVYLLLREGLPDLMDVICEAADHWDSEEQYLAKPNHPNAERLYFIRRVTEVFFVSFGQPMRELTLELTSVYFDCCDISEADLSRLAPVRNIRSPFIRTAVQNAD